MREIIPDGRVLLFSVTLFKKFHLILITFLCINSLNGFGQKVVFSENFDQSTSLQPWSPYYSSGWFNTSPLNVIQAESGKGNVLRVNYPAGSIGSASGIGNYRIPLDSSYKELYLSWEYFVPTYFDYGWSDRKGGGKFFAGFAGGSMPVIPNNDNTELDGWGSILMFQDGYLSTYNYFKGTTYTAEGWPLGSRVANIVKGQWRRITIRMKVNDGDQPNGLFEVFDNDVLSYQLTNAKIVNALHPEYLIEHIYLNSFFGGYGNEYVSPITQYMAFDNLVAFYYPSGTSGYRPGPSETGRTLVIPAATSYHPLPPNRFTPSVYTESSGTITSHCGFYQPVNHPGFETSTIEVSGASSITIDVTKFDFDKGLTSPEAAQILRIYQGKGNGKTLVKTHQVLVNTSTGRINISGNTATVEWQAGLGLHGGFSLNYYSDGTGSGQNFSCGNYVATQGGIPLKIPEMPGSLQKLGVGDYSAEIQWTDNSDNEDWFEIERRGPNSSTTAHIIKVNPNITKLSDAGLQPYSTYLYRIRAYNSLSGASAWTSQIEVKTTMPVPGTPTTLIVTTASVNSITIQWNDNSVNEEKFFIERTGPGDSQNMQTFECTANTTMFVDNGLIANSSYKYRVRAYNSISGYSAYTAVLDAKTILPPPAAPESLSLIDVSADEVTIQWIDQAFGETLFEIERRGPNNNDVLVNFICAANTTQYTDTLLQWGSVYTYRIRAYNPAGGYSAWSNLLQVQTENLPVPNAPSQLKGRDFTNESITLHWKDNSSDEKGFVVTRTLALDNSSATTFNVKENDTVFTDLGLAPNQIYVYAVKAVNEIGSSPFSNSNVASTLSVAETKRIKNGLIAYYNFTYVPGTYIYDFSEHDSPLNLKILQPDRIDWGAHRKLKIKSNTEICSDVPAKKIINAVKESGEITIDCWIKPDEPLFSGESRVISIGSDENETGFVLNQNYDIDGEKKKLSYSVRLQTESTNEGGYPLITQNGSCESVGLTHVAYRKDANGNEALFINGKKTAEGFRASSLNSWNDNFYLRLGNEKDRTKGWLGSLYSVGVYNRCLADDEIRTNYSVNACDSLKSSIVFNLSVYPNPVKGETFLQIDPLSISDYVPHTILRITDANGAIISEQPIFNPNQRYSKTLDFSKYKSGIYFVQVISGSSQVTTKVILQ